MYFPLFYKKKKEIDAHNKQRPVIKSMAFLSFSVSILLAASSFIPIAAVADWTTKKL